MLLSSLNRIKLLNNIPLTQATNDVSIANALAGVSSRVENYLKRRIKKTNYSQVLAPNIEENFLRLVATPISSITEVSYDSTGLFNGNQTIIPATSYRISADGKDIIFNDVNFFPYNINLMPAMVRVNYVGGLSEHATISILRIDDLVGTPLIGDIVNGFDSGAYGRVVKVALDVTVDDEEVDQIYVEMTSGAFVDGEDLTIGASTATLNQHDRYSLAETHPDIVQAIDIQSWYIHKNKSNLENATFEADTVSRRSPASDLAVNYNFLPDVRATLEQYRNKLIDYKMGDN